VILDLLYFQCHLSLVAFLFYDYLLTWSSEVSLYWLDWRFTSTSFFFLANRYVSLFGHIPVIIEFFAPISPESCDRFALYHQCYSGVSSVLIAILLIIRTYALYERQRGVLLLLLGVAAIGMGVCIWSIIPTHNLPHLTDDPEVLLVARCDHSLTTAQGRFLVAPWASILLFDTTVFVLTLYRRIVIGRTFHHGLLALMLRDGIIFYGVLLVLYVSNITTLLAAEPPIKGISVTFTNVISASMMNRLMLNVRQSQRTNYNAISILRFPDNELDVERPSLDERGIDVPDAPSSQNDTSV